MHSPIFRPPSGHAFRQWMADQERNPEVDRLMEELWKTNDAEASPEKIRKGLDRLHAKIRRSRLRRVLRYAGAAAAAVLMFAGAIFRHPFRKACRADYAGDGERPHGGIHPARRFARMAQRREPARIRCRFSGRSASDALRRSLFRSKTGKNVFL